MKKAWETRRANMRANPDAHAVVEPRVTRVRTLAQPRPYPESARIKARADAIERLQHGARVSKFERKVAEVFRSLGFVVLTSFPLRRADGTFACVFDIVIPQRRIIVECHGTYWHGGRWTWDTPTAAQLKNLTYEERKLVTSKKMGLELRILWEHEFKRDPCGACLAVVR